MNILYDQTIGCIRVVKAERDEFKVKFTCNTNLKHCTMQISGGGPLGPDFCYDGQNINMIYNHTVVPAFMQDAFRDSYEKACLFCNEQNKRLLEILHKIERDEEI